EVRIRLPWPTSGAESAAGGHGGITPACVALRIACARGTASRALVSANGAIPPCTWQLAHLSWRIGATSAYVGVPPPPWPGVTTARAAAASARTATSLTEETLAAVERERILAQDHAGG